jgi:hypothetical protein
VVRFPTGTRIISLFATASRPAPRPVEPPIQWVTEVKRLGREADHSLPSPRSRMSGAIPPLPQYAFIAWRLVKQRIRLDGVVLS